MARPVRLCKIIGESYPLHHSLSSHYFVFFLTTTPRFVRLRSDLFGCAHLICDRDEFKKGHTRAVPNSANNKRLIWMIFTALEEDDTIRRGIWPRKGDSVSGKSKSTHYKNLAQKVRVSEPEFQPLVTKNNGKAATHFGTSNDITQSDVMDPISSSIRCTYIFTL